MYFNLTIMQEKLPIYFPQHQSQGFFKSKNSKFEAFLFPCHNQEEIDNELKNLRKKYFDATHICYAWRLGFDNPTYRANDDGEPNYTAGIPIYRKIVSYEISNILIAVVRYFGGTKLGVSGLIQAYETAAELAIQNTNLQIYTPKNFIQLSAPIQNIHWIYQVLNSLEYKILKEEYSENEVIFTLEIQQKDFEIIYKKTHELSINFFKI